MSHGSTCQLRASSKLLIFGWTGTKALENHTVTTAIGAGCSVVEVDTLTGSFQVFLQLIINYRLLVALYL